MQSKLLGLERRDRLLARAGADDDELAVASADELDDAVALALVVLDHEEPADRRIEEADEPGEGVAEVVRRDGLLQVGDGAGRQGVLALARRADDVHGDVPGLVEPLELLEDGQAVDARELGVEDDGVGPVLPGHGERRVASTGDEDPEPALPTRGRRLLEQVEVGADEEEHAVAFADRASRSSGISGSSDEATAMTPSLSWRRTSPRGTSSQASAAAAASP